MTASSRRFLQLCSKNLYRYHEGPACLVCRRPSQSIPGREGTEFSHAPAQRRKSLAGLQQALAGTNRSEPAAVAESSAGGAMTALTRLGHEPRRRCKPVHTWWAKGMTVATTFTYGW